MCDNLFSAVAASRHISKWAKVIQRGRKLVNTKWVTWFNVPTRSHPPTVFFVLARYYSMQSLFRQFRIYTLPVRCPQSLCVERLFVYVICWMKMMVSHGPNKNHFRVVTEYHVSRTIFFTTMRHMSLCVCVCVFPHSPNEFIVSHRGPRTLAFIHTHTDTTSLLSVRLLNTSSTSVDDDRFSHVVFFLLLRRSLLFYIFSCLKLMQRNTHWPKTHTETLFKN